VTRVALDASALLAMLLAATKGADRGVEASKYSTLMHADQGG
jgi:hypothetical protein